MIDKLSSKLNVYIYELPYQSTANYALNSYYGEDLYNILERIKLSKKELFLYLICSGKELPSAQFSHSYPKLDFEECMVPSFLKDMLCCGHSNYDLYNFVDNEYDEMVGDNKKQWKERIEAIDNLIGSTDVLFDYDDEIDEEYD